MSKKSVPKADGIKRLRGLGAVGDTAVCLKPGDRPTRYKGYYRALKRGELWAVELSKKPPLEHLLGWVYGHHIATLALIENPFLRLVPKYIEFTGKYYPVPIAPEDKDDE